jgi:hypothetical protein
VNNERAADWLLSTEGRVARIAFGTGVILIGLALIGGFIGVLFLLIGAVPITSAAYGTLLVGPRLGRDIRGRKPEDAADEPEDDEDSDEDEDAPEADPNWSAPPLARAERAPGQEARTRDLRAED